MAIPSEYNDRPTTTGATNMSHPVYNLVAHMIRNDQESIGPLTNLKTGTVLHPDMHQSDPDLGRACAARHEHQFSTWVPGLLAGSNAVIKNGEVRTAEAQGAQGTYFSDIIEILS